MSKSIGEKFKESFKYGGNSEYLDLMYEEYLENPSNLSPEWKQYFDSIQNGQIDVSHQAIKQEFKDTKYKNKEIQIKVGETTSKASDVQNLINAYRRRGHEVANLDPLNLRPKKEVSDLNLDFHNLSQSDLDLDFSFSNFQGSKNLKLSEIIESIKKTYTSTIGYEFMHIMDLSLIHI